MRFLLSSAAMFLALCQLCQGQCPSQGPLVEKFVMLSREYVSLLDNSKQPEAPSISENSTTLANTSGASDTATLSLNPALTTTNSRSPKSTDIATSFSLAALNAAVQARNPLEGTYYQSSRDLRRISISLTDSFPGGSKATADQGSNSYGVKFVINPRDTTSTKNTVALCTFFTDAQLQSSAAFKSALVKVATYLYTASQAQVHTTLGLDQQVLNDQKQFAEAMTSNTQLLGALISNAPKDLQPEINMLVEQAIPEILNQAMVDSRLSKAAQTLKSMINAPQFAVEYSARISKGSSSNLYRTQVDYDQTFWKLTATTNVGYDFQNAQTQGAQNRHIGRLVQQFQYPVPWPYKRVTPKFAASGEGDWGSNGAPIYKTQGKLTFTLFAGVDVPFAVTYVSRTGAKNQSDVKGQMGLAIDFTKLWVHPPRASVF